MEISKLLKEGKIKSAIDLIKNSKFNPEYIEPDTGFNLIHRLVQNSQIQPLDALLELPDENQPELETKDLSNRVKNFFIKTPLALALSIGLDDIALALIDVGADPNIIYKGKSMLMYASFVKLK